jgi:Domain of unknown function (DUF4410)
MMKGDTMRNHVIDGSEAMRQVMRKMGPVASSLAPGLVLTAMAVTAMAGCARVSTQYLQNTTDRLARPALILVQDYQTSPDNIRLDGALSSRLKRAVNGTKTADQLKIEQEVSQTLTTTLVDEIRKLGIPAEPARMAPPVVAGPTLSIEGQIVSIDEGNKATRLVIGLGSGASEVRTLTQVYEITSENQHRLIEDFYTTTKSSRKPGFGPMAEVGAAAGLAASHAAAAGGVGLATALLQTVDADVKHSAKQIAKELGKLFVAQGWIGQAQADTLFWDR